MPWEDSQAAAVPCPARAGPHPLARPPAHHLADAWARLRSADGVLVPGGFGGRGVEGKILAAHYARTNDVPYLGICLGMQIAVVEFARNVLGMEEANSTEWEPATPNPVVVFMPEGEAAPCWSCQSCWRAPGSAPPACAPHNFETDRACVRAGSTTHKGGTMRLGSRRTVLETVDCIAAKLYQQERYVDERHRHRWGADGRAAGGAGSWVAWHADASPTLHPCCRCAGTRSTQSWCLSLRRRGCALWARTKPGSAWRLWSWRGIASLWLLSSTLSSSRGRSRHPRCS